MVTRSEAFPSRWLKPADLKGQPCVLEIKDAKYEQVKFGDSKEQQKLVLSFVGTDKTFICNITNFEAIEGITGQPDSDDWAGCVVEAYPTTTEVRGEETDCIRFRAPMQKDMQLAAKAPKLPPAPEAPPKGAMDDGIPF
jgi:hypothetical protein